MKTALCLAMAAAAALADVSYESTAQITGGALVQMANMPLIGGKIKESLKPQISTTALKGDRLIHRSDKTATIIDVAKENFTTIDFVANTYSVVTFAEMKAAYEKALAKMSSQVKEKKDVDMTMEFDVKETGNTSTVSGLSCKELLLSTKTIATDPQTGRSGEFVMNDVMCVAKDAPGSDEFKKFYTRMAEKMQFDPSAMQSAQAGFFGQSLGQMQKKARMMDGMPVIQYVTIGASSDGLPASIEAAEKQEKAAAAAQAQQPAGPTGKDVMSAAAGSVLGGFGGFGRKKKETAPAQAAPASAEASGAPASLMQMKIVESGFSTNAVDAAIFNVPAGFKQAENEFVKRSK